MRPALVSSKSSAIFFPEMLPAAYTPASAFMDSISRASYLEMSNDDIWAPRSFHCDFWQSVQVSAN